MIEIKRVNDEEAKVSITGDRQTIMAEMLMMFSALSRVLGKEEAEDFVMFAVCTWLKYKEDEAVKCPTLVN